MANIKTVALDDRQIRIMIDTYKEKQSEISNKIENLKTEIDQLMKDSSEYDAIIKNLSEANILQEAEQIDNPRKDGASKSDNYNVKWSLAKKAEYVLRKRGRASLVTDIWGFLHELDETFLLSNKRETSTALSASLGSNAKKGNLFGRYQNDLGLFVYGLKDWFTSTGEIKEEFK